MTRWFEGANDASFKRVADGYVFQSPNPWIFAWPRYYLVSQTQKAEILAHLARSRLLLLTCTLAFFVLLGSFIAFVMLSPATFIRLVEPALRLGFGTFFLIIILMLTLVIAPIVAAPQIYLFRGLRPLLAAA